MKKICLLISIFCCLNGKAQTFKDDKSTEKADSILVAQHIARLNNAFEEDGSDSGIGFTSGTVSLSPDKKLKIVTLTGNAGGMYANTMYASYLQFYSKGKRKEISYDFEISNIQQIIRLPEKNGSSYLILHGYGARARAVEFVECNVATHILIKNDTIVHRPFILSEGDSTREFRSCTSHMCEGKVESFLKYDEKTKSLRYSHCTLDSENYSGIDSKGLFIFKLGHFIKLPSEEKEKIVPLEEADPEKEETGND